AKNASTVPTILEGERGWHRGIKTRCRDFGARLPPRESDRGNVSIQLDTPTEISHALGKEIKTSAKENHTSCSLALPRGTRLVCDSLRVDVTNLCVDLLHDHSIILDCLAYPLARSCRSSSRPV